MASQISMDERRFWPMYVVRKFDKYWKIKLPCPVDSMEDVYRMAYTGEEWNAMQLLRRDKVGALSQQSSFSLFWTDDRTGTSRCPHATFKFPRDEPYPNFGVDLDRLPDPVQRKLRHWITNVEYFRSLSQELEARCKGVMGNPTGTGKGWTARRRRDLDPCVNTPGQLYRLWPDVQPVMDPAWKRTIQLSSVKSRLPSHLGFEVRREERLIWSTPEQFRCESEDTLPEEKKRFKQINHILCMVSMADEVPDPKRYPTFHGDVYNP